MTTVRPREMQTSLQSSEESGGQLLGAEDSLMSALLPAVLSDVYPTVFTTDHPYLSQVPATYTSVSSPSSLTLSPPPTSPGCLQMPDTQLPGELAHAFHLVILGPRHYTMLYEAMHAPLMEEIPDVSVISPCSLTLATHYTSSLLLLTLQFPVLCAMVSVVTMMVMSPHHTSRLSSPQMSVASPRPDCVAQPPPLPGDGWAQGKGTFPCVPECSRPQEVRGTSDDDFYLSSNIRRCPTVAPPTQPT